MEDIEQLKSVAFFADDESDYTPKPIVAQKVAAADPPAVAQSGLACAAPPASANQHSASDSLDSAFDAASEVEELSKMVVGHEEFLIRGMMAYSNLYQFQRLFAGCQSSMFKDFATASKYLLDALYAIDVVTKEAAEAKRKVMLKLCPSMELLNDKLDKLNHARVARDAVDAAAAAAKTDSA